MLRRPVRVSHPWSTHAAHAALALQPVKPMGPGSPAYFASRILPALYIPLHITASLMVYWASSAAPLALAGCPWVLPLLMVSMGFCATVGKGAGHELIHS
eukprot:scaffold4684_cov22-Tisochrysis_lutea.AAC.1